MLTPRDVRNHIEALTADFISLSLCNDQNYPQLTKTSGNHEEVTFCGDQNLSIVLKNMPYKDLYSELERTRAYNIKMLDGALIQIMYLFENGNIKKHRLAFYPSPDLEEYQNNPEVYEEDEIYADILMKNIVSFPVRFDFDSSDEIFKEHYHSKSHLTLGQYKNCRIPVSAPLSPTKFIDFILKSFYNTAHRKFSENIKMHEGSFPACISNNEKARTHLFLP